jgi:CheY-like chemotaxis protein
MNTEHRALCVSCQTPCRPTDRFCSQCGRANPAGKRSEPDTVTVDADTTTAMGFAVVNAAGVAVDRPLASGYVFARRYRIERLVGEGGMGRVYLAVDNAIDEPIALKILSATFSANTAMLDQFKRELKLARKIRHRNVVASFHLGDAQGRSYITQEYIDAENLSSLVDRRGPLGEVESLNILRQVLRGLKAAHDLGIVHRDVKASNILVNKDGLAFVTDFGLAVSGSQAQGLDVAGTPQYMAPELFSGQPATPASDLYACGVLLFFLMTSRFPFPGRNFNDVLYAHQQLTPKPIPARLEVSAPIRRIQERMLSREIADRPQRVSDVLEVIEDVLAVDALSLRHGRPMALVADADPAVRTPAREVLESEGYDVEEVTTASEAIDRAFTHDPALVVMDSNVEGGGNIAMADDVSGPLGDDILPRHGGLRLCRLLQSDARLRRVPILVLAAQRHPGLKPAFQAMGASEVIAKPFTREEFAAGAQRARGAALARADEN